MIDIEKYENLSDEERIDQGTVSRVARREGKCTYDYDFFYKEEM